MAIPAYSLIRILVNGVDYKAGELARYSHRIAHATAFGMTLEAVLGDEHSINVIRRAFVGIHDGQFEVIPGHMEYEVGDEVYISTMHKTYGQKPFKVVACMGNKNYRIKYEDLETYAHISALIPVHVGNKHNKHVLERGD